MFESDRPGTHSSPNLSAERCFPAIVGVGLVVCSLQIPAWAQTTPSEQAPEVSKTPESVANTSACLEQQFLHVEFSFWSPYGDEAFKEWPDGGARFSFRLCLTKPWEGPKKARSMHSVLGSLRASRMRSLQPQLGSLPQVWQSELTTDGNGQIPPRLPCWWRDTGDLFRVHMRSH